MYVPVDFINEPPAVTSVLNVLSGLTVTCAIGFAGGCVVAAAGAGKSLHFYSAILEVLGFGMMTLFVGINTTIAVVSYGSAKSSHPIMSVTFITCGVGAYMYFSVLMTNVFQSMSLEFYHLPAPMKAASLSVSMFTFFENSLKDDGIVSKAKKQAEAMRNHFLETKRD